MATNDLQKQLSKLRRDKKILWLGVLFFVLVVLWILVGIFATTKTSSISPAQRELAKSFVPRLESRVFDVILQKQLYEQGSLDEFPIYVLAKNQADGLAQKVDIMQQMAAPVETPVASPSSLESSAASVLQEELSVSDGDASLAAEAVEE